MTGNNVLAVDIGGTNIRVALINGRKIKNYMKFSTPKTKKELDEVLISAISQVIGKNVKAIGVGCPGPLKNGIILNPPNLPWKNFDLKKFLEKKFKKKVVVENDAKCVALAELNYGIKKNNFVILTLGTGVGGGVIIDGKLYKGQGNAGEIGHMIIDENKDLETHWQKYRKLSNKYFGKVLTFKELCSMKNKKAKHILDYVSIHLGQGVANLIDIFDPEVIILMGGAREAGKKFLEIIKKQAYHFSIVKNKTPIKWSKIKHPGLLGASLLVR